MSAFTRHAVYGLCAVLLTTLTLSAKAETQKIASAGGTLTELIYALAAQEQLIAVDTSSTTPAETKDKHSIGYYRRLSAEAVLPQAHSNCGPWRAPAQKQRLPN